LCAIGGYIKTDVISASMWVTRARQGAMGK